MRPQMLLTGLLSLLLLGGTAFGGISSNLPHVQKEMTQEAFWREWIPDPDRPLLTPEEILRLNRHLLPLEPSAVDVTVLAENLPGSELRRRIQEDLKLFRGRSFYTWDAAGGNVLFGTMELELLKERMKFKEIPSEIPVRFGLIVQDADLRSLPLREGLFEEKRDRDFDLVQQTRLAIGTPVAVLGESEEGEWVYLLSSLLQGWVEAPAVGFFQNQASLTQHLEKPFLVVTAPVLKCATRSGSEEFHAALTMGTVLHGYQERDLFYEVEYPVRGQDGALTFWTFPIPKSQGIHEGFLPFTRANVLRQALQLEGFPYGWGGLGGGYDCSGFLHDVFLTMGVALPRNSGPQSNAGKVLATFPDGTDTKSKRGALMSASPLTTFLKLDGHIMLYLGRVRKRPYVIHAASGYQSWRLFRNKRNRLMSVVISDLSLGRRGRTGSLLERIVSINTLTK